MSNSQADFYKVPMKNDFCNPFFNRIAMRAAININFKGIIALTCILHQ
jgi:hypothetical protein